MPLNVKPVARGAPSTITTYDFTDIATGTGIEIYYGGQTSGAYFLTPNIVYSDATLTSSGLWGGAAASKAYNDELVIPFDVEFVLQRTMKGTCVINVPIGVQSTNAGKSFQDHASCALVIVRDGTPTTIVDGISANFLFSSLGAGQSSHAMTCTRMDVPETIIEAGDTLRVVVQLYTNNLNTETHYHFIGHDPQNRALSYANPAGHAAGLLDFGTDPSILTAQIPFKIDTT